MAGWSTEGTWSITTSGRTCRSASNRVAKSMRSAPVHQRLWRARHLPLELDDPVDQRLGPGRTPGHEHIHRNHLVDALDDGVVVEDAADRRTGAHGDHPLGLGH